MHMYTHLSSGSPHKLGQEAAQAAERDMLVVYPVINICASIY